MPDIGAPQVLVRVTDVRDIEGAVSSLALDEPRPTLVLVGGAGGLDDAALDRLRPLFTDVVVPLAERTRACVLDGGTDAGVMALLGQARTASGAAFPLIGVVAEGTVGATPGPSTVPDGSGLEPNHTHFVLVPGSAWGDETPWLARVAGVLARDRPSVTILVDGGQIALDDVKESIEAGRPTVVWAGTGRLADTFGPMAEGRGEEERAETLLDSPLVRVIHTADGAGANLAALLAMLGDDG